MSIALGACSAVPTATPVTPMVPSAPAAAPAVTPDPSFDWHGLLVVPFGSDRQTLQSSLHEVLFFHDDADADVKSEAEDCYTFASAPPRFIGRPTDHYFLCFHNDRLNRIQAVVTLPSETAPELFAQFCDAWPRDGRARSSGARKCEGGDGAAAFSARLEPAAEERETEFSIVVRPAAAPN